MHCAREKAEHSMVRYMIDMTRGKIISRSTSSHTFYSCEMRVSVAFRAYTKYLGMG